MSDRPKSGRKDEQMRREVLDEIVSEIRQVHVGTHYANSNRDHARGDWDRSRKRGDEGRSRDEA